MIPHKRFIFFLLCTLGSSIVGELDLIFKWNQMSFDVPPEMQANYDIYNSVPMGVTHHKGRLFVAIPRRAPGVLSTLNVISTEDAAKNPSPPLRPYPSLEMNMINSTEYPVGERIISVYRMRMDTCDRMWFVDTGRHENGRNSVQEHVPTIWAIDTLTDTIAEKFVYPFPIPQEGSGSVSLAVDIPNDTDCGGAFIYIPDLIEATVYVFSLREKKMWRFRHNYFYMNPHHGDYQVAGLEFQWPDHIFSITVSAQDCRGFRTAYFHPMSSFSEFAVSTEILRNETLTRRRFHGDDFKFLGTRGPKRQSASHYYDNTTGVIFFAEVNRNAVGCWNTAKPMVPEFIGTVMQDDERFIYPADINVDSDGYLWVITNTMPLWFYASLDTNETNFRVWSAKTKDIIRGTVCEV